MAVYFQCCSDDSVSSWILTSCHTGRPQVGGDAVV